MMIKVVLKNIGLRYKPHFYYFRYLSTRFFQISYIFIFGRFNFRAPYLRESFSFNFRPLYMGEL